MERQLTGHVKELKGDTVPSGEKIRQVLESKAPVVLLIDEIIEYLIPAKGIEIGKTTLDSQILSFLKRLSEAVSSVDKCILLVTSPSRTHYTQEDQNLMTLLYERLGRVEKSYTPVEEEEISSIIRKRLFSKIDEEDAKKTVAELIEYFKEEDILPQGIEPSEYRQEFLESYPFLPDVIDCLYHRWGSFPTFQRTRGVLRLLSLILYNLKDQNLNYISLADINLKDPEIRRELLNHIGNEFDSVISADITDKNSGSKQTDNSLGAAYKGLQLGTRSAITIFMYSFSGGVEKGASINEIKRSASFGSVPSSIVSETLETLKDKLFYIQHHTGKIVFANQPNLNRILLNKIESIDDKEASNTEKEYLQQHTKQGKLRTYIWINQSNDVSDDSELKLIILNEQSKSFVSEIVENRGASKRINRNTLFFLAPIESKRREITLSIKRKMAFEQIILDAYHNLTEDQKKEVKSSVKREEENGRSKIREVYRNVYVPMKNKVDEIDLGVPTYGYDTNLSDEVFEKLKSEGTIIARLVPLVLRERYLKGRKHVLTKQIYENSVKTLGEDRITNISILEDCIRDGVKQGLYGLGELKDGKEIPIYWKKEPSVGFGDNEILIDSLICEKELEIKQERLETVQEEVITETVVDKSSKKRVISTIDTPMIKIPKGKVSQILGLLNYLQTKFNKLEIKIVAEDGSVTEDEYDNKIKEALRQLGIKID